MKSFLKQIEESFQSLDEKAAKPDFLDLDKDGDTEEPMKKAAKEKNEAAKPDYLDFDKDGDTDEPMKKALKDKDEDELEEASVTGGLDGGAGPPRTPYAFSKKEKKKMKYPGVAEAMDRKYEKLIEGYKQFSLGNGKSSPNQTVNRSIREVAKQLKSIEETIKHTSRLKTESGISNSGFTTGTKNALNKISERLIKISERVRSLGE